SARIDVRMPRDKILCGKVPAHACVEPIPQLSSPFASGFGQGDVKAERVVGRRLQDGAGNGVVLVGDSLEAESRGLERNRTATSHRIDHTWFATPQPPRRGMCSIQIPRPEGAAKRAGPMWVGDLLARCP